MFPKTHLSFPEHFCIFVLYVEKRILYDENLRYYVLSAIRQKQIILVLFFMETNSKELISSTAKSQETLQGNMQQEEQQIQTNTNTTEKLSDEALYLQIDEKLQAEDYISAKELVATLLADCMEAGKSLSPKLKSYILSDWYREHKATEPKDEVVAGHTTTKVEQEPEQLPDTYVMHRDIPAIVVGRNIPKRIVNLAWGREQEGFFKWNFRTPLPQYNDVLSVTFEQKVPRSVMAVKSALPYLGELNFDEDFYKKEIGKLKLNEEGQLSYKEYTLAPFLFGNQDITLLREGEDVEVHWIYKYLPREKAFDWSITKVVVLNQAEALEQEEAHHPIAPLPEPVRTVVKVEHETTAEAEPTAQQELQEAETHSEEKIQKAQPSEQVETHTLIINDIPLRNGELTCRCITNENEQIYFRKSLIKLEVNRLDKLIITGLVRTESFGKYFVKIDQVKLAKDEDFPSTILRKTVKRLHKQGGVIFLDDEQLATRKVQLLRLKHLMMRAGSSDVMVEVEEMYLYAVHIKDYEWTIASVKLQGDSTQEQDSPSEIPHQAIAKDLDLSPSEKAKQEASLRQPWQVRVAYISKVNKDLGRVEIIYGVKKKGYIKLEDFPLPTPYQGDWLGMKMLDGHEPLHEIVFNEIIRLDPNKRLPNTSKLIYKVRRGVLWYSEQDHIFKLHNAPISQAIVLAMDNPKYKDYFLVEELLDFDEAKGEFAWRPIKIEKFEYLETADEMEGHIFPHKFRQKELFNKAISALNALAQKVAKQEVPQKEEEIIEEKVKEEPIVAQSKAQCCCPAPRKQEQSMQEAIRSFVKENERLDKETVSFCPQRVSKRRVKTIKRGRKALGLRSNRKA